MKPFPDETPPDQMRATEPTQAPSDARLYVPRPDQISLQIKTSPDKVYCFSHRPGEEHFHLILHGEIHLKSGHEVYCLDCAERLGFITRDRQFWQRREAWFT